MGKVAAASDSSTSDSSASDSSAGIKKHSYSRLMWCDIAGLRRLRVVPTQRLEDSVHQEGVSIAPIVFGMCSYDDRAADGVGIGFNKDVRAVPDLGARYRLPWCPRQELVMVDLQQPLGTPFPFCARHVLRRVEEQLEKELGLTAQLGFENEFLLLTPNPDPSAEYKLLPADSKPYCHGHAFELQAQLLAEMGDNAAAMGFTVEQIHPEAAGGQFEISIKHASPLKAADNTVALREMLMAVAAKAGYQASFVPKYFVNEPGNGTHVHLSFWKDGKNVVQGGPNDPDAKFGMSVIGRQMVAGILEHLPALLAFTTPNPVSFARIQPNTWSGAFRTWGDENRECTVRTCGPSSSAAPLVTHVELKAVDGTANPYVAAAAIIAAAADGIKRQLALPDPIAVNPGDSGALANADELRLPTSLDKAVECLEMSAHRQVFEAALGKEFVHALIAIRKTDCELYKPLSHAEGADRVASRF